MAKLLFSIFTVLALICTVLTQNGIPTSEESIEELVNAGVSENAAVGIVKFDDKFTEPFELEKTDPVAAKKQIDELHEEFNNYISSLSDDDKSAYQQYIKNKNSRFI